MLYRDGIKGESNKQSLKNFSNNSSFSTVCITEFFSPSSLLVRCGIIDMVNSVTTKKKNTSVLIRT